MIHVKAVLIAKPTTRAEDPMSFRIMSVLCLLYKEWAKHRLEDLSPLGC